MKIAIRYSATFQYESAVSFSPHLARLFPRRDLSLQPERLSLATHPSAIVSHRLDLFDNLVGHCFYPDPLDCLEFHLEIDLALAPKNPFQFLLESHAFEAPFSYLPHEAAVLSPYLARTEALDLPDELKPRLSPTPTVDLLVALNSWLHRHIAYERREEGAAHPAGRTLRERTGSCRDFSVLGAAVLREHGIAARLASGFLWETDDPATPRRAENALHAWIEAYLPGAGWVGLDPTNGVFCDHHAIATAVGLSPEDIAPIAGHYYGKKAVASALKTALSIQSVS